MAPTQRRLPDRRGGRRYPVDTRLEYKAVLRNGSVLTGQGRTINISGGGILFQAVRSLPEGLGIELFVDWPVRLKTGAEPSVHVDVKLYAKGRIVRVQDGKTAVIIRTHQFRTRVQRVENSRLHDRAEVRLVQTFRQAAKDN